MHRRSPLDYDISVSADKERRSRRRGLTGAFEGAHRGCDAPGCDARGEYRAPKSREALDEFWWFCLDHVRDYNRNWNFFADLPPDEFEATLEADRLWGRPTWKFAGGPGRKPVNGHSEGLAWRRFGFADPMEVLGDRATINPGEKGAGPGPLRRLPQTERRALDILGAGDAMRKAEIRRRYKDLVKALHPDMNGGSRAEEARLQEVVWAWEQIRASTAIPD